MYESIMTFLRKWSTNTTERQKLQHLYGTLFVVFIVVSGLITLLDEVTGRKLLDIAFYAAVIFVVNAVAWALLQSFVLSRLPARRISSKNSK